MSPICLFGIFIVEDEAGADTVLDAVVEDVDVTVVIAEDANGATAIKRFI